jgi:hypothetical protein
MAAAPVIESAYSRFWPLYDLALLLLPIMWSREESLQGS